MRRNLLLFVLCLFLLCLSQVDFKALKMMTEEDGLSGIGIPLGEYAVFPLDCGRLLRCTY